MVNAAVFQATVFAFLGGGGSPHHQPRQPATSHNDHPSPLSPSSSCSQHKQIYHHPAVSSILLGHSSVISPFSPHLPSLVNESTGWIHESLFESSNAFLPPKEATSKISSLSDSDNEDLLLRKCTGSTSTDGPDASSLEPLCRLLGIQPNDHLRLETTDDGVRGVWLNKPIQKGERILSVPLSSCLVDDEPPEWWLHAKKQELLDDDNTNAYGSPSDWAPRLAASLIDLQLRQQQEEQVDSVHDDVVLGQRLWLSYLPNPNYLRASLPVHWSEEMLQGARCTALELAVDSSYFARASAVQDLLDGLESASPPLPAEELRQLCENALDVVQTRSCRVERMAMGDEAVVGGYPLRVLAPVFDMFNHGDAKCRGEGSANARFGLGEVDVGEEGTSELHLCIRATRDLPADEEVLIDYGESARPSWKCLLSYGFVPQYRAIPESAQEAEDGDEDEDDENVAEVYMDGVRYEVGPTTIPVDMVAVAAIVSPNMDQEQQDEQGAPVLTPEIALRIAKRIHTAAYWLLLDDQKKVEAMEGVEEEDTPGDDEFYPEELISSKLAASLRWSQHRILVACANGLNEWAGQ